MNATPNLFMLVANIEEAVKMPAPPHVELLRSFVNTIDYDEGTDALLAPADLDRWLSEHELVPGRGQPTGEGPDAGGPSDGGPTGGGSTEDDLAVAQSLRAGLRSAMIDHHDADLDEPPSHLGELEEVARALPLRLSFATGSPRLAATGHGTRAGLEALLVAVAEAEADGSWERLKLCPADDCQWAFYDASKNRSRTWCAMRVCGNRHKTRAYRARHRDGPEPAG